MADFFWMELVNFQNYFFGLKYKYFSANVRISITKNLFSN